MNIYSHPTHAMPVTISSYYNICFYYVLGTYLMYYDNYVITTLSSYTAIIVLWICSLMSFVYTGQERHGVPITLVTMIIL